MKFINKLCVLYNKTNSYIFIKCLINKERILKVSMYQVSHSSRSEIDKTPVLYDVLCGTSPLNTIRSSTDI